MRAFHVLAPILLLTACQQEDQIQTPRLVENCVSATNIAPNTFRISDGRVDSTGYAEVWIRNSSPYYVTQFRVCARNPAPACHEMEVFISENSEQRVTFQALPDEVVQGPRHFSVEARGQACQLTPAT